MGAAPPAAAAASAAAAEASAEVEAEAEPLDHRSREARDAVFTPTRLAGLFDDEDSVEGDEGMEPPRDESMDF